MLLEPSILTWQPARKVAPVYVKHISAVVTGVDVTRFKLSTLEADESLQDSVMICRGIEGELWPQLPSKLLNAYNIVSVSDTGWYRCEPKVGSPSILAAQVLTIPHSVTKFHIVAQWGDLRHDTRGNQYYGQSGTIGDWVCKNPTDPTDLWVIRSDIFNKTYQLG